MWPESYTESQPEDFCGAKDEVEIRLGESGYVNNTTRRVGLLSANQLREDVMDHLSMHIGQSKLAALVFVRQSLVVDAQLVQHGRL